MFKVGDKVRVVDSLYPKRIGNVGLIGEVEGGLVYLCFRDILNYWISVDSLELFVPEPILSNQTEWNSPTLEEVESIVTNMPGGLDGFLKGWGWLQFAREVEKLCKEKNA